MPGLIPGGLLFLLFVILYHYPSKNPLEKGFYVSVISADDPIVFAGYTAGSNGRMNSNTHKGMSQNNVHAIFTARIRVDEEGEYGFSLEANDSAILRIAGIRLLSSADSKLHKGSIYLLSGFHEITIEYKNRYLPGFIDLKWSPPNSKRYRPVPVSYLYSEHPTVQNIDDENRFILHYNTLIWSLIVMLLIIIVLRIKKSSGCSARTDFRVAASLFVFLLLLHVPFLDIDHQAGVRYLAAMSLTGRVLTGFILFVLLSGWLKPYGLLIKNTLHHKPRLRWVFGFTALIMSICGQVMFVRATPEHSYVLPVAFYAMSAAFILLTGFRPEFVRKPSVDKPLSAKPLFYMLFFTVLIWSAWVRFYRIDEIPPGFWWDEAQTGRVVRHILEGDYPPIYDLRINAGTVASYLNAGWCLMVRSTDPWSLRTWTGFVGVMTVVASWWFFRQLFTAWWSLFGMALLAGSRWLFSINRIAMAMIDETILITILILTFYFKVMRRNRVGDHLITGILVGLAMYLHTGARVLPLAIGADIIIRLMRFRRIGWKKRFFNAALLIFVSVAVFTPMAIYLVENLDSYMKRSRETLLSTEYPGWYPVGPYLRNTRYYLEMYVYRGDWHPRHNYQRTPQLATAASVLTALGLFLALGHARKHPVHRMLLTTFVLVSIQGIATVHLDSANLNRVAVNIPVVAVWTVFGAVFVSNGIRTVFKERWARFVSFVVMVLIVISIWYQEYSVYFYKYPKWRALAELYGFQVDVVTIARISRDRIETDPDIRVWAMYAGGDPFHYVFPGHERLKILSSGRIPDIHPDYPAVILLPAHEHRMVRMLQNAFPDGTVTTVPYPLNTSIPLVKILEIKARKTGNPQE